MSGKKSSSRVVTFDLMRGYFLVAIILDHLFFFPNGLDWWSARGNLFVTTAEGFFLISGLVLGIVRGSKLIDEPFRKVTKLLLQRAVQLYLTTITLVALFTIIGWLFFMNASGLKYGIMVPIDIPNLIWSIITLQYFYGWADYLRLYALFILVSPVAMWLLRKGWWYILLLINILVWLTFPADPTVPDITQEFLQIFSWQLLFFGGMIIGFYWNQLSAWWISLPSRIQKTIQWGAITFAVITLVANIAIAFGPKYFPSLVPFIQSDTGYKLYIHYFDKERLPFARIALFLLWFGASFSLFKYFEKAIMRWLGWLLLPFGTNSLYVYTVHGLIIFFVHIWLVKGSIFFNFLVSLGIILLIRLMIHYKILMNIIPR
jgi:hypothetical protein